MVRRSTRSRSRGRTVKNLTGENLTEAKKSETPTEQKKTKKTEEKPKMQFEEGSEVMARWPGSSLYFTAKVTLVREEENEYDVEFENTTVVTTKAKDVYNSSSKVLRKTRGTKRSKSRAKSVGRGKKTADASEPLVDSEKSVDTEEETEPESDDKSVEEEKPEIPAEEEPMIVEPIVVEPTVVEPSVVETSVIETSSVNIIETSVLKVVEKIKKVTKTVKSKTPTPSRISARLAAKAITDNFSDDEDNGKLKLAPNPELPDARGRKNNGWTFEWVWSLIFMVLGPLILVTLHTLCAKNGCKLVTPEISTEVADYVNKEAITLLFGFCAVLNIFSFIPIGTRVNGRRMNGFATLLILLSVVPALVYYKVPLKIVSANYFQLMSGCILFSFMGALKFYILSRWAPKYSLNPKGNTGNPIVDIFNGRTTSPVVLGIDGKLQAFRFSMVGLAVLNVLLVTDSIVTAGGKGNPTIVLAAAFQVLYALDAMYFEEYYFHSHDAMNSGFGYSLISSYMTFPFLPTLITQYLLRQSPVVAWYYLALIGLMNAVGYVVFRSSETQRCEFAKDPSNPALAHLEAVTTAGNRKLIVSGWWGLVRHPNYLGETLIQWSWVLPAVSTTGLTDLVPYYLPFVTTLMLIIRCQQINQRNKKKYGSAWTTYTENVRSNMIPKVY